MLASNAMRLVAPARHAAAAGRVLLVSSKLQQGPAQLRGHPWNTRAEATDAAQTGKTRCLTMVLGLALASPHVLCSSRNLVWSDKRCDPPAALTMLACHYASHRTLCSQLHAGTSQLSPVYLCCCCPPAIAAEYAGPPPLFTGFNIYKGKGAVTVKPMRPRWSTMESGAFKLDK